MAEKTIEQLAGGQQGMPVSTTMGQGQGIQAPRYQVGERLAEDLLGAIGETGRVAQKVYDASVEGAKRIALDKSEEMAMHIEHVKQFYNENDPDHLRAMEADIAMKFMELSNEKFKLHDAQMAFDNAFTKPVGVSTAKLSTALKKQELELDDEWNKSDILDKTLVQYSNYSPLGAEQFDTKVDMMSAYEGKPSREGNMLKIAKTATQSFDTKVDTAFEELIRVGGYNSSEGLTNDFKARVFESNFGDEYGYIDKDTGEIQWREKFDSETGRQEVLNSWNGFIKVAEDAFDVDLKMGRSGIPASVSAIGFDGVVSWQEAQQYVEDYDKELAEYVNIDASITGNKTYQMLVARRNEASAKATLLKHASAEYEKFATDPSYTWEDYMNNVTNREVKYRDTTQDVSMNYSDGDAVSFAQNQFNVYDKAMRQTNYTEVLSKTGINPYKAAASMERRSGGKVKSKYLQGLVKDITTNSYINGTDYPSLKSEYQKTIDYMSEKRSLEGSWLFGNTDEIDNIFTVLDADIEAGRIKPQDAFVKGKRMVEGVQNMAIAEKNIYNSDRAKILRETFDEIDADDAIGRGFWDFDVEIGDMKWAGYSKTLAVEVFNKDLTINVNNKDAIGKFISSRFIPLRSSGIGHGAVVGGLALPFRDAIIIYTDGRDLKQDRVSNLIAHRIRESVGDEKYSDITDDTVSITQYRSDDNNEIITAVAVSAAYGEPPTHIITFTMDELEKGIPNKTTAQVMSEQKQKQAQKKRTELENKVVPIGYEEENKKKNIWSPENWNKD